VNREAKVSGKSGAKLSWATSGVNARCADELGAMY
jgi:hypothetical protein